MKTVDESQYRALRAAATVTWPSDRSFLAVGGAECAEFLQSQVTNDIEALSCGEGCYAVLLTNKGKLQADLRAIHRDSDFLIDTEPLAHQALLEHLRRFKVGYRVEIEDLSDVLSLVTLMGPRSSEVIDKAVGESVGLPEDEHAHTPDRIEDCDLRVVATDRGVTGFDLIVDSVNASSVETCLRDFGAIHISPETAECNRIESGIPRYGIDMTSDNFPAEAGLEARAVSFEKGCYIGQEPVARMHYRGHPNRRLMGLTSSTQMETGEVLTHSEKKVGTVGSSCVSPRLGPIALAIVRREVNPGDEVNLGEGEKRAEVVRLPFINGSN